MFLRGLLPAIQYQLQNYLICNNVLTFRGVVTAAQQYEQSQVAHLQALTEAAPPISANLAATATVPATVAPVDPLKDLMGQMTQLLQPMTNAISQSQHQMVQLQQRPSAVPRQQYQPAPTYNQANPQYRPRQPRNTLTCHRCGQYGHIARVCPNPLAPQAPVQPTPAPQPQPTLLATTAPATEPLTTQVQPQGLPQQYATPAPQPTVSQAPTVRFASPGQIPRPDIANYCAPSEQDSEFLNF